MRTIPILKLSGAEEIRTLFRDGPDGAILIGTSQGRILLVKNLSSTAYMTGDRTIYANTVDGNGVSSDTASMNIRYGLINKIVEMSSEMSVIRWKDVNQPSGAESVKTVSGVFTTPVMWAGEDFGWWGNASWTQTLNGGRAVVAIRIASSEAGLLSAPWRTNESIDSELVTWPLEDMSAAGGYAQFRVVLESEISETSPVVSGLVIPYYAKHASYFFLTKLTMTKGSGIKGGLITAAVSVPKHTEVKWGVSNSNSASWNDFMPVTLDKLFELSESFGDRLKVGAKLLAYDDERYPSIDEFAVAFDSNIDNLVNR